MTDKQAPESRGTEVSQIVRDAATAWAHMLATTCGKPIDEGHRPYFIMGWRAALLATQRSTEPAVRGDAEALRDARLLIKECLDALDIELAAWDLDPPLDHVKKAHGRCIEWLAQTPEGKDET